MERRVFNICINLNNVSVGEISNRIETEFIKCNKYGRRIEKPLAECVMKWVKRDKYTSNFSINVLFLVSTLKMKGWFNES